MAWPLYEVINERKLGSDFALITPNYWLMDFAEASFKDEVKPCILKGNAMRPLGFG